MATTWVLVYSHRHGVDVSSHDSPTLAEEAAVDIVREYYETEVPADLRTPILEALAASRWAAALELYQQATMESLDIHETEVQTAKPGTPLKPMCPKCTSTDPTDIEIKETYSAYHPVLGVNSRNQLGVESALGTSSPSEHFDDGASDYVAHCKCCQHDGPVQSFGLGEPSEWEWL